MEHPKFRAAFDLLSLRAEIERNRSCSVWRSGGPSSGLRTAGAERHAHWP